VTAAADAGLAARFYLGRDAGLSGFKRIVATLFPVVAILFALTALNLEKVAPSVFADSLPRGMKDLRGRICLLISSWQMKTAAQPDPVIEFYMRDVDRSLLRENLKLTPAQRLEKLVRFCSFASTLKQSDKRARTRAKR
jgi:hypothetical protein